MNLYHISQTERQGYETYSDAVVAALSPIDASRINPSQSEEFYDAFDSCGEWASSPDNVKVVYLGVAAPGVKRGIICKSFHAG